MLRTMRTLLCLALALGVAPAAGPAGAAVSEPERLWTIGVQAFEDGLYDVTYRELGRFVQVAPADARRGDATVLRGKSAFALTWYAEALAEFQAAEQLPLRAFSPGEPLFWQAEVLFRLRQYEQARDRYSEFLRDHPSSPYAPDALYARGFSELELGQADEALATFDTLLRAHPASELAGSAAYAAARELVRAKRWNEATALLSTYASRFPQSRFLAETQYLLGVAQMESGETAEGVKTLEGFVRASPAHELAPAAHALLAEAHLKAGRAGEAVDQYRALARDAPKNALVPQALYQIGELSEGLGRPQDAEAAWKALRRDYPGDPLAELAGLGLATFYLKRKQLDSAVEVARQVAEARGTQRLDALLVLGESALRAGKAADARSAYAQALDEAPVDSPARYRALAGTGLVAETQKDADGAKRAYGEIVEKAGDQDLVQWAKGRLQGLEAREKAPPRPTPRARPKPKPAVGRGGRS